MDAKFRPRRKSWLNIKLLVDSNYSQNVHWFPFLGFYLDFHCTKNNFNPYWLSTSSNPTPANHNDKNINYFCNGNWYDINSYSFIIYVTPDVLWIQVFKFEYSKLLFCWFWTARVIYFDLYPSTCNSYWDISRFHYQLTESKLRGFLFSPSIQ